MKNREGIKVISRTANSNGSLDWDVKHTLGFQRPV